MKKKDKKATESPTQSEIIDNYITDLEKKDKKQKRKKRLPSFKRRRRFVMPIIIVIVLILTLSGLVYFDIVNPKEVLNLIVPETSSKIIDISSETLSEPPTISSEENAPSPSRPGKLFGTTVVPEEDFSLLNAKEEFGAIANEIKGNGFTTVFIPLNAKMSLFTDTQVGKEAIISVCEAAHSSNLTVFGILDVTELAGGDPTETKSSQFILKKALELAEIKGLDGIMLSGLETANQNDDFKTHLLLGTLSGFKEYRQNLLTALVKNLSETIHQKNPTMLIGSVCDSVYATQDVLQTGLNTECDSQLLRDKNADVLLWMNDGYFDIVFVNADTTTNSKTLPFEDLVNWWSKNTPPTCDLGFILSSDLALKGEGDWNNPDQLGRQLNILNEINRYVFSFNSYSALKNDTSGSSNLVYKYLKGEVEDDYVMKELSITSPAKTDFSTYDNSVAIIGASDPNFPLILNGKEAERTEDGYFSLQLDLKVGNNKFTFEHKGTTKIFNINYRYVVIKSYSPASSLKLEGGSTILVKATARTGSSVTASLNGKTATLEITEGEKYSDFSIYSGALTLPEGKEKDVFLGNIKFKGSHNGVKESFLGGSITVLKKEPEPSSEPVTSSPETSAEEISSDGESKNPAATVTSNSNPVSVGNTLIAEVSKYQVETFDGDKVNDLSQPYNSYLPKGTLDYCSENTIYDSSSGNTYRLLRYGKRVYTVSKGIKNIKTYRGTLPSTNKLSVNSVSTGGSHTIIRFGTAWKAPFTLELSPQKYQSKTGSLRGTISSATFNYIDITFSYASKFRGSLETIKNSPVFSRAQIIKNTSSYTLRLYLKKTGAFYGWTASYNKSGELVFEFLNPAKATKANNKYGGRLDGITIAVDPGHGGSDPGAVGSVSNSALTESNRSLLLAKMIKERLESIGATVVMTRTTDVSLTPDERILKVRNAKPNLAVSVHRNAATKATARGFSAHYFNPYTKLAADKIRTHTQASGKYTSTKTEWHVFYMSRISSCPVVLTENGFMTNSNDFNNMKSDKWNRECADAIVAGIVDYFLTIG